MNDPSRFGIGDEPSRAADLKNLRVVAVLHYVAGALLALFSCVFIACIWLGVRSMTTHEPGAPFPVGPLVVGMGSVALVLGWTMAGMMVQAGRCIEARRNRRLCLIVAALSTAWFPFGSILGLFTLVLLTKPHVRAQFGEYVAPPAGAIRPDDDPAWAGWVSADAKARFVRRATFIGAGLLVVQLAVPMVMLARTLGGVTWGTNVIVDEAESADTYAGRVWFVESVSGPGVAASKRLANVAADDDGAPALGADLPGPSRFLVADGRRLWILGEKTLAVYEAGRVSTSPSANAPYWPSRPFDYGGRPAFFDWSGRCDRIGMVRLEGEEWRKVPGSSWRTSSELTSLPGTWSVLPAESGFDVFMQFGSDLRWRHIGADDGLDDPQAWEPVTRSARYWSAVRQAGESLVVLPAHTGLFDHSSSVLHRTEAGWVVMNTIPAAAWASLGVTSSRSDSMDLVLSQASGIQTLTVSGDKAQTLHTHERAPLAAPADVRSPTVVAVFAFVPSLIAAALLGRMMRRERIGLLGGDRPLQFASLLRRGLASGIDSSAGWIVMIPQWWRFLRTPLSLEKTHEHMWASILIGVGCWIGTVLVTSYTEGRWGVTPGKWVFGIRVVGTDGVVCGFSRALLRNVLRIIDGTMTYGVGIFVVAFTRNWQRFGDLAAKTVVVRTDPSAPGR